jgi:TonB family protein
VSSTARLASQPVFKQSLLPDGKKRWSSFGASFGLQCVALAVVLVIPLMFPERFQAVQHYWVTPIEAPVIQPWKPQPPQKPVVIKKEIVKEIPPPKLPEIVAPKPKIYNPVVSAPVVRQVRKAPEAVEVAKVFPDPTPQISLGSSAAPTLRKPREQVQTGGFGDPNSVPDNNNKNRNPNMSAQGSFDLPGGPGSGNGTGGAKGAKGVTGSAGFGNGVAVGTAGGGSRSGVQQGVFADEEAATAPRVKQTAAVSNTKPAEILFKPKPVYTSEARDKKIEGDVRLQVIFSAAGDVKVEKVVQGLGYGLDESAEAAARQIRFHPALQDGQPVDFPAVIRITFELAY